jgi:SAM-dependent methyltransferase
MLELGAGAGRNTPRYLGFDRIVLIDYSRTQLEQAQARLGKTDKYIYVAADVYRLPFVDGLFDAATMIRVLHHMADAPKALGQVKNVLDSGGTFILEFASKKNLKAILRYWLGRQKWSPFTPEPVEFVELNFDFHPKAVVDWLKDLGFSVERILTVSHFRAGFLKRIVPTGILVFFDSILQWTGAVVQLTPSVFVKSIGGSQASESANRELSVLEFFKCPDCGISPLSDRVDHLECSRCKKKWEMKDGIYDFREPINS